MQSSALVFRGQSGGMLVSGMLTVLLFGHLRESTRCCPRRRLSPAKTVDILHHLIAIICHATERGEYWGLITSNARRSDGLIMPDLNFCIPTPRVLDALDRVMTVTGAGDAKLTLDGTLRLVMMKLMMIL